MGSIDPIFYLESRTLLRLFQFRKNQKAVLHEYMGEEICRYTKIMNKSCNTHRLTFENKKILTLMPIKSQVHLRLSRVRFLTVHFAWIFAYFLQTIFLANAVIWLFHWHAKKFVASQTYRIKDRNTTRLDYVNWQILILKF